MQRKNYGPQMRKGTLTSSHDAHYTTRTPAKKTVIAIVMLVLVALWIASNNGTSYAAVSVSKTASAYGTVSASNSSSSAVQKFQLMFGQFTTAQEYVASAHFDILSVGYWGDPGADYNYVPIYKRDYPNVKILGYIDLAWITSADWMVSQWNTYGAPYGYDGIFLDDSSPNHGISGVSNTQALLDTLLQTLKSRLPNMLICANGVGDVNNGVPLADTYNYVNIGTLEEFAYAQGWGRSTQFDINSLAYWTGRGVTIATIHSGPYYNDARGSSAPADTQANCQFALASYLLGVQGNRGYFGWNEVWSSSQGYYPIMDIDPGTPLGAYVQVGNILYRNFTKVNVTVDLTAMTGKIEALP
jgi:hypothetical protein